MKVNKVTISLITTLSIIVIFLLGVIFQMILSNFTKSRIPDYNYHLALVVENNLGKTLSVAEFGGADWEKICFLGPYSNDSSEVIGFDWEITDYTDVLDSDGHNVLVFVADGAVQDFIVHIRSKGDFSTLSGSCLKRNQQVIITKNKAVKAI